MTNKDLDLPTQQELLAQYRCDEISSAAFETFTKATSSYKKPVESGQILPELGQGMLAARTAALKTFDISASRYHPDVYKRKRVELLTKTNATLHTFYLGQLKNLRKKSLTLFQETLKTETKKDSVDFLDIVQKARAVSEKLFVDGASEMVLEDTDWEFEEDMSQLDDEFSEVSARFRAEELKKLEKNLEKQIEREISEPLSVQLNNPTPDVWTPIINSYVTAVDNATTMLMNRAKSFNASEVENTEAVINLEQRSWLMFRRKVDEELADAMILLKLRNRFEEKFRYDERGLPRVWKPEDDIDGYFADAKEETLKLVPIYSKISTDFSLPSTDDFDFPATLIILGESKQADLSARFKRESDAFYLEAKRSTVTTTAKIPFYVIVLLCVLGWNEFLTIISSPLYLMLTVFLGGLGYVIYMLNMWSTIERALRLAIAEGMKLATDQVKEGQEKLREQGLELKSFTPDKKDN